MEPKLPCENRHLFQATNDLSAVDFDDQPFKSRVIRQLSAKVLHRYRILQKSDWQVDRDFDAVVPGNEVAPIIDRAADDKIRERTEVRIAVARYEIRRRNDPPSRMSDADERLGAAQRE